MHGQERPANLKRKGVEELPAKIILTGAVHNVGFNNEFKLCRDKLLADGSHWWLTRCEDVAIYLATGRASLNVSKVHDKNVFDDIFYRRKNWGNIFGSFNLIMKDEASAVSAAVAGQVGWEECVGPDRLERSNKISIWTCSGAPGSNKRFKKACLETPAEDVSVDMAAAITPPLRCLAWSYILSPTELITSYTKRRCPGWSESVAIAELVQNWRDEADAAAESIGQAMQHVKVHYHCETGDKENSSTYSLYVLPPDKPTTILGTLRVTRTTTWMPSIGEKVLGYRHGKWQSAKVEDIRKLDGSPPKFLVIWDDGACSDLQIGHIKNKKGAICVELINFSDKMFPEMFLDGWSGDDKAAGKRRGKFGDGLQSGTAVLVRNSSVTFSLESSGHKWLFDWKAPAQLSGPNADCLRIKLSPCPAVQGRFDCSTDTRISVEGLPASAFNESHFLFLNKVFNTRPNSSIISNFAGDILLVPELKGTIYVKDMRTVIGNGRNMYCLNFRLLDVQSRDRVNHLPEGDKFYHTFLVWHIEMLERNLEAAKLLYSALQDSDSLEAQAWKFNIENVSETAATLLAEVFFAEHVGKFPISETDDAGDAIVKNKLRKDPVKLSEKLYAILRISPEVLSPQEAWQKMRTKLVCDSTDVDWTDEYTLAVKIVHEALCTHVRTRVTYEDCLPEEDLQFTLVASQGSPRPRVVVSNVPPGSVADDQEILVGCELVEVQGAAPDTCRFEAPGHAVSIQTLLGPNPTQPLILMFEHPVLELCIGQFRLVFRKDIDLPLVVDWQASSDNADAAQKLRTATFVVNKSACPFHESPDEAIGECDWVGQDACFCGVELLWESCIDELEKFVGLKLSRKQKRSMLARRQQLLHKHAEQFAESQHLRRKKMNFQQPEPEPELGLNTAATSDPKPKPDLEATATFERIMEAYTLGNTSALTMEDKHALCVSEKFAAALQEHRANKDESHDPQAAWLGDRLNDSYLAAIGVSSGLTPRQMDNIRQSVLSTKGLSSGRGRAVAENVEAQVGKEAKQLIPEICKLLSPALQAARTPPDGESVLERLTAAVHDALDASLHEAQGSQPPVILKSRSQVSSQRKRLDEPWTCLEKTCWYSSNTREWYRVLYWNADLGQLACHRYVKMEGAEKAWQWQFNSSEPLVSVRHKGTPALNYSGYHLTVGDMVAVGNSNAQGELRWHGPHGQVRLWQLDREQGYD